MLLMPLPDQSVLARRAEIVVRLRRIVPGEGVIDSDIERRAYESDGLTAYRQLPMVVVLPRRDLTLWRRPAAGGRRAARHGQVQAHPGD